MELVTVLARVALAVVLVATLLIITVAAHAVATRDDDQEEEEALETRLPTRAGADARPGLRPATVRRPVGAAGRHRRGDPMTALVRAARWTAAWARWRLAAWRAARAAWRDGADLLTALPPARADLREPCPLCGGRHCAGCETPARVTSLAVNHVPRHDFAEVPPSIRWLAERVHVTFRGTLITASLVGRRVWRPADGAAFRVWARRKLGRELQLGGPRPLGVLP